MRPPASFVLLPLCACLALPLAAQPPTGLPSLQGATVREGRLLDAAGGEVGLVAADPARGARVAFPSAGGVLLAGQTHSETVLTLTPTADAPPGDYLFEAHFILAPPQGFYAHLLILSPRVGADPDAAFRISYRFCSPCPVANNNTGFYLVNTATEDYRRAPLSAAPLAGAPYRLTPGREYVAWTLVRDLPEGVNLRFYLHDTTVSGDDARPLFEYTATVATRLPPGDRPRVQVGTGGLIEPAAPAWFGSLGLYPLQEFESRRRAAQPSAALPAAALAPLPVPQATQVPNLFSDHMVLQRGKPLAVWGRGLDGDTVTVTLAGRSARAQVRDGTWRATLPPFPAGGPHVLCVAARDRTLTFADVMVGEVWVLGGQSNMSWYLRDTTEAERELPAADFPAIRVFSGWHPAAADPQFQLAGGSWKVVSPQLQGACSAVGYYLAKSLHQALHVPIGLLDTSTPATGIECWLSEAAAESLWREQLHPLPGRLLPGLGDPSCYYNGKVAPLLPCAVAGIAWYQGDGSTAATGTAYRRYLPALIRDWREGFGQGDLPVLIVQIPGYRGCSPEMREAQLLAAQALPRVGLAVTLDTSDGTDIHPRHKRPVGERLALLARQLVYGEHLEGSGPLYRSLRLEGGHACLDFDHVGGGLVLRGEGGFEVCGADGVYVAARAAVAADGRLRVWADNVASPRAVRYAWASVPAYSLYNTDGLPASPFRTDSP